MSFTIDERIRPFVDTIDRFGFDLGSRHHADGYLSQPRRELRIRELPETPPVDGDES